MKAIGNGLAAFGALLLALGTTSVLAGDDASIKGELRTGIQSAMSDFVEEQTVNGVVRLYDPVDGRLLELKSYELHSGIMRKGDFYVSCADFVDASGSKIDVDFLVIEDGDRLKVTQGIVHSVDGKKREYHLESH